MLVFSIHKITLINFMWAVFILSFMPISRLMFFLSRFCYFTFFYVATESHNLRWMCFFFSSRWQLFQRHFIHSQMTSGQSLIGLKSNVKQTFTQFNFRWPKITNHPITIKVCMFILYILIANRTLYSDTSFSTRKLIIKTPNFVRTIFELSR